MKEPCVGYSPQALGERRAMSLDLRLEMRKECRLLCREIATAAAAGANGDRRRDLTGCVLTYRHPQPGDWTNCCGRKIALWIERIELRVQPAG